MVLPLETLYTFDEDFLFLECYSMHSKIELKEKLSKNIFQQLVGIGKYSVEKNADWQC